MYKKNARAQQPLLLSDINDLPERTKKFLRGSWAETFRREVFLRIPEDRFRVLYDPDPSRPNVAVNVLVGLDILKSGYGWSDEELYEHFLFDLQVRYAVGCDNFGEGDFDLRTLYYFRKRVSEHALTSGENLFQVVFETITDQQIQKLNLNTHLQRMDSTQILSNIADQSRLELLVEVLQRLYRVLDEADQARYQEAFAPYLKESAGQYTYRLRGKEAVWQHIEQVGIVLDGLLTQLAAYQAEPVYQTAQRFFEENFQRVEAQVQAKTNAEISPGCLQSLDDLEATYRVKGGHAYKGYVANLSETCAPENPVQLITQTQTAPNRTSDIRLLQAVLPELKRRTGLTQLVSDGGYVSEAIDQQMRDEQVSLLTTGLTGELPHKKPGKLALSDFEMQLDEHGCVTQATCPTGQIAKIHPSNSGKSFHLIFDPLTCQACPHFAAGHCPVKTSKHKQAVFLPVPKERANSSQRRRRFEQCKAEARALRPAIEATVFQLKHTFRNGKVRVRGLLRTTQLVIAAALTVNFRRIYRFETGKLRGKLTSKKAKEAADASFSSGFQFRRWPLHWLRAGLCTCLDC